jgi:hypothetical protein
LGTFNLDRVEKIMQIYLISYNEKAGVSLDR